MSQKVKFTVGMQGLIEEREANVPDDEPRVIGVDGKDLTAIGARAPRLDGLAKVTGRAKYTYDINRPGMLHAKFLRCPHPAATIASIDASKAEALPGVKAVETFQNKVIRFAGEAVAAVAAESREICDDALALIEVKYNKKPFVVDKEIARRPGAPSVFDGNNVNSRDSGKPRNEVQAVIEKSDAKFEDTYRTQVQTHSALETHGAVAEWDGENLTVWTSTQGTFGVRKDLAEAFNIKESQVRVISEHMGGGFGAKFGAGEWSVTAARLARKTKAPVKLMLDREGEHLCTGNRPDSIQTLRAGADKSGKLTALDVTTIGTPGIGGGGAGASVPMIYNFPIFSKTEENVQTNAGPAAAMRAPGHPQGSFALEQLIDSLAEEVGMDPVEFRKKNDSHPVRQKEYDIGAKAIGWAERRNKKAGAGSGSIKTGIGVGAAKWGNWGGPPAAVAVNISPDGSIEARNGAQDIGTGTRTLIAICVAEELGLAPDDIAVFMGDTNDPVGPASGGSRTAASIGPAARKAGYLAALKLAELAAAQLSAKPDEIAFKDKKVFVKSDPTRSLTWKKVCSLIKANKLTVLGERAQNFADWQGEMGGVQFAEVEVDTDTGVVRVVKVVAVHDAARVINPLTLESQIIGGVIQGVSYALFENRILDRNTGTMVNPNLEQYKIAGSLDMPEIVPIIVDWANGKNNIGMGCIGEPTAIPTAAAVANAVYNAIGVRVKEIPITPARVLAALGKVKEAQS